MNHETQWQTTLLEGFQAFLGQPGIDTNLLEPDGSVLFRTLVVRFPGIGPAERALNFELCFPPGISSARENAYLIQTFVVLEEQVPVTSVDELLWLVARLNTRLPLGAFGLFDDTRALYYKHSFLLSDRLELEQNVKLLDQTCGLLLHVLGLFLETCLEVSEGRSNARAALAANPLAHVFDPA